VRFLKIIRFRRVEATIYGKPENTHFTWIADYVAGKRGKAFGRWFRVKMQMSASVRGRIFLKA